MNIGPAHKKANLPSLASLNQHLSQAQALIGLYEKSANSQVGSKAELEQVQREMKIMKNELLSELMRSKNLLMKMQMQMQMQEGGL